MSAMRTRVIETRIQTVLTILLEHANTIITLDNSLRALSAELHQLTSFTPLYFHVLIILYFSIILSLFISLASKITAAAFEL